MSAPAWSSFSSRRRWSAGSGSRSQQMLDRSVGMEVTIARLLRCWSFKRTLECRDALMGKRTLANSMPTTFQKAIAEVVGTFILILFGCGAVHAAVLTGAQVGIWQAAIVWGFGVTLAVYVVGGISGAHINPAVTIALAAWGRFGWREVPAYIVAQLAGAFLAAAALFAIYAHNLTDRERELNVQRNGEGGVLTAMCYGEVYPSPGPLATSKEPFTMTKWDAYKTKGTHPIAFGAEVLGTAILALVIFALTDPRNEGGPPARTAPLFIGLCVALLISITGPLTQCCLNPARDFGPRLF